jgi:hypothetical protein
MSEGKREPIVKNNEVVNERIPLSVLKFLSRDRDASCGG